MEGGILWGLSAAAWGEIVIGDGGEIVTQNFDRYPVGPNIVSGPMTITAPDGHVIEHPGSVALCRCGGSSNKPFCDGTHATIDFDGTLAN